MTMKRNPFFLPSGLEPQEIINILEGAREAKGRLDKIKERKREERSHVKRFRYNSRASNISTKRYSKIVPYIKNGFKHFKQQEILKTDQIQYGFDLAKWWGELHE